MHAKLKTRNLRNLRADLRDEWPPERRKLRLRRTRFGATLFRVFGRIHGRDETTYRPEA